MIRLLLFFVLLALVAYGGLWLVQHPGHVDLDWFGYEIKTSAALLILAVAVVAVFGWIIVRVVFGLPSFVRLASRQRRREKGYAALSQGLIAIGAGDARAASRASAKAKRQLSDDPLALVLEAQAAHLGHDGDRAVRAYEQLANRDDTRVLGLRGLFAEASRRGDEAAARHFATAAHETTPLPWSAQAVLERRAVDGDWEAALATVEASAGAGLIDPETSARQRAVLETAIAYEKEATAPDQALALARAAMKRAPDLAPPVVLASRLLARRGDIRKAARIVEKAWPSCQHPDIADAYLNVRSGDSTTDRLARAKALMGISTFDPVSRMMVARAGLANKDFATARDAMAPLVAEGKRPTIRMCQLMAEIEEAEYGDIGQWREWLARASRAALDPAWVADGIVYEEWSPVSPSTGKLDAFRWQVPAERLGATMDALPVRAPSVAALPADHNHVLLPAMPTTPTQQDLDAGAAAELATTPAQDAAGREPTPSVIAGENAAKPDDKAFNALPLSMDALPASSAVATHDAGETPVNSELVVANGSERVLELSKDDAIATRESVGNGQPVPVRSLRSRNSFTSG